MKRRQSMICLFYFCSVAILCVMMKSVCAESFEPYDRIIELENGVITFHAIVDYERQENLPTYTAKQIVWDSNTIVDFAPIAGYLTNSTGEELVDMDEGTVLLLDRECMERIAFLKYPQEAFHYMTGNSDQFYTNVNEGTYLTETYTFPSLKDICIFNSDELDQLRAVISFLDGKKVEIGAPLEMTVFKNQNGQPEEAVVAFVRRFNGIRLMPWGQRLTSQDFTHSTFAVFYLDAQGITDIQIPLVLSDIQTGESAPVLSLSQAITALGVCYDELLFLPKDSFIDYVALEYAPIQMDSESLSFELIPVWSFYTNYQDDDSRSVISLNAYTGIHVF